jgi:hypothetical protein
MAGSGPAPWAHRRIRQSRVEAEIHAPRRKSRHGRAEGICRRAVLEPAKDPSRSSPGLRPGRRRTVPPEPAADPVTSLVEARPRGCAPHAAHPEADCLEMADPETVHPEGDGSAWSVPASRPDPMVADSGMAARDGHPGSRLRGRHRKPTSRRSWSSPSFPGMPSFPWILLSSPWFPLRSRGAP